MPNDNKQSNSSTQNGKNENIPPVFQNEDTLPPMMDNTIGNQSPLSATPSTSSTQNDIVNSSVIPTMVTSSSKKKFAGGKVIATILGLFLLVGGLGAGILLVQQQQLIGEKAAGTDCTTKGYFDTVYTDANGDNAGTCKSTTKTFDSNLVACDGSGQTCRQYLDELTTQTGVQKDLDGCYNDMTSCLKPGGKDVSFRYFYDTVKDNCNSTNHRYDSQDIDVDDINHRTCVQNLGIYPNNVKKVCYGTKDACKIDNGIVVSSVYCQAISLYSENWVLLTDSTIKTLTSGKKVNICATGNAGIVGIFTKAKFTINGVERNETSTKRPDSNDYCDLYTIPATGVLTFNVTAKLYHTELGWK